MLHMFGLVEPFSNYLQLIIYIQIQDFGSTNAK